MQLHSKQKEAILNKSRYKVLNWGRRCFIGTTPITLDDGSEKQIKDIKVGDYVISINTETNKPESKVVTEVHNFGVDYCPKPMIQCNVYGKSITATYDHEFRSGNKWIPLYQLAWGNMETSQREKLELLCKQYGQDINYKTLRRLQNSGDETSTRPFWVLQDSNGQKDSESSSCSCRNIYSKSFVKALCKPQRQQPEQQCSGKLGMGNQQGESGALQEARKTCSKVWGILWNAFSNRKRSYRDNGDKERIEEVKPCTIKGIGSNVFNKSGIDKRYFERKDLEISDIKVLESIETYDLTVEDNHNYVAHGFSVHNSGKTTLFAYEALGTALTIDNAKVTYYAQTFDDARSIAWDIFLEVFGGAVINKNESRLEITIKNTLGGTSMINLKGWESVYQSGKGRGTENNLILCDEVAFCRMFIENWEKVLAPTLLTTKGRAVFGSTPNGFNDFYKLSEMARNNDEWWYSHATSYDNEYNDPAEIDKIKNQISEDRFYQEYLADFRKIEGLIYKEFNRTIHVVDFLPHNVIDKFTGIDFGYTNPTACVVVHKDNDNRFWVVDEWYKREKTNQEVIEYVKTLDATSYYPDPAEPDRIEEMKRAGMNVKEVNKDVEKGIDSVRNLFKNRKLLIHSSCKNLIWELENYQYKPNSSIGNTQESPLKENDHLCFAEDTMINTEGGYKKIKDISVGDKILGGEVLKIEKTGKKKVYNFMGSLVTSNHPYLTQRGFVSLDTLRYDDTITVWNQKQSLLTGLDLEDTQNQKGVSFATILYLLQRNVLAIKQNVYTGIYGKNIMVTYQKAITSIIETVYQLTMTYLTSNLSQLKNTMQGIMTRISQNGELISAMQSQKQVNGVKQTKDRSSEANKESSMQNTFLDITLLETATNVEKSTLQKQSLESSATVIAKLQHCGVEDVYSITTDSGYFYANDVLVSNCDALRYCLFMQNGIIKADNFSRDRHYQLKRSITNTI